MHTPSCVGILFVFVLLQSARTFAAVPVHEATVYINETTLEASIVLGKKDFNSGAAVASYSPTVNETGWDFLHVDALPNVAAKSAAYAAGYAEGYLTSQSIHSMLVNNYADWFLNGGNRTSKSNEIYDWLEKNLLYIRASSAHSEDPFWVQASLLVSQLDGMVDGVNAATPSQKFEMRDLLLLNADGDVESLVEALTSNFGRKKELRCSSLVKLVEGPEIVLGHTTWDHFDMDLRSLKTYRFRYRDLDPVNITMSSSPAFLSSVDDFYLTSRGLSVIETTNGIFNNSLWSKVSADTVLSWMRVNIANSLAEDNEQWAKLFSTENSGTYNNQWMVVNNKLVAEAQRKDDGKLLPGTFLVLEQIPGQVEYKDMTPHLQSETYWGSYNIPYFKGIYDVSGFGSQTPRWAFSHDECPRAKIFAARHSKVVDIESYKKLIRYNDFQHDPLSRGDACNQISARCDLNAFNSTDYALSGGLDAKVTTATRALSHMSFDAQCGPTTYGQKPFSWSSAQADPLPSHRGMPDTFEFNWVTFK